MISLILYVRITKAAELDLNSLQC